jgi:hypothetical protein
VVITEDNNQTTMKVLELSGADEDSAGIMRERNVERWTEIE